MSDWLCGHWTAAGLCGSTEDVRSFLTGHRCPEHTPARLTGHPEIVPDPRRTLDGLRAAKGLRFTYRATDSALIDDRARASGRRRSKGSEFRDSQKAEDERKNLERARRRRKT